MLAGKRLAIIVVVLAPFVLAGAIALVIFGKTHDPTARPVGLELRVGREPKCLAGGEEAGPAAQLVGVEGGDLGVAEAGAEMVGGDRPQ